MFNETNHTHRNQRSSFVSGVRQSGSILRGQDKKGKPVKVIKSGKEEKKYPILYLLYQKQEQTIFFLTRNICSVQTHSGLAHIRSLRTHKLGPTALPARLDI